MCTVPRCLQEEDKPKNLEVRVILNENDNFEIP